MAEDRAMRFAWLIVPMALVIGACLGACASDDGGSIAGCGSNVTGADAGASTDGGGDAGDAGAKKTPPPCPTGGGSCGEHGW
jgi:hypothetical protein